MKRSGWGIYAILLILIVVNGGFLYSLQLKVTQLQTDKEALRAELNVIQKSEAERVYLRS